MSDITAEEYRTAAKVLQSAEFTGFCGRFPGEASWCQSEADRLEAESARDEEAEKLAEAIWEGGPRSAAYPWERLSESSKGFYRIQARAALDFLAADGRLLPEGGTVLTAEQAEDVRWMLGLLSDMSFTADRENESYKRLVALFTPPAVSVPDSGPDGTPEKHWPTWQDVPDGVRYQGSTRYGDKSPVFVNRDGQRITEWRPGVEFANTHPDCAVERWAPFVRVDGDRA
ncbi:hypothetical protein [Prescottella equi]|uniref:hypothetical protein n=1 Tax=Rhodococcus hoagii TaxID=43767 RepID=UPI001EEA2AC9|nr:hypothetical protein [Prescottella equi]